MVHTGKDGGSGAGGLVRQSNPLSPHHLPPGHNGHVRANSQRMERLQPGPVELSNMFSLLSALGGNMVPPNISNGF